MTINNDAFDITIQNILTSQNMVKFVQLEPRTPVLVLLAVWGPLRPPPPPPCGWQVGGSHPAGALSC